MRAARPSSSTGVRFPPELHERLREAAEDRDVSVNWLVVKAVEDFLTRLLPADEIVWTRREDAPPPTRIVDTTPLSDRHRAARILATYATWSTDLAVLDAIVSDPVQRDVCYDSAKAACALSKTAQADIERIYGALNGRRHASDCGLGPNHEGACNTARPGSARSSIDRMEALRRAVHLPTCHDPNHEGFCS